MDAKIISLQAKWLPTFYSMSRTAGATFPLFTTTVRAGFPSPAADYHSEPINIQEYLTQNPTSTFFVKVEGDSMIGAHIEPGDLAVVDRSKKAESGNIVLAFLEGDFTIKRLILKPDGAYLVPENPRYTTIKVDHPDAGYIWGVVVGSVKVFR